MRSELDVEIAAVDFKNAKFKKHEYDELYRVIFTLMTESNTVPESITTLLKYYEDVFS